MKERSDWQQKIGKISMRIWQCLTWGLLLMSVTTVADVFTLMPAKRKSGAGSINVLTPLDQSLAARKLWSEPIVYNGHNLSLGVALLDTDLNYYLAKLKRMYPGASFRRNRNSVLCQISHSDGTREKLYLVQVGGDFPVIQFSMNLPADVSRKSVAVPTTDLALPNGVQVKSRIELPNRHAIYSDFTYSGPKEQGVMEITKNLTSAGWIPVTPDARTFKSGKVFYRKEPESVFVVTMTPDKKGGASGAVYKKQLSK